MWREVKNILVLCLGAVCTVLRKTTFYWTLNDCRLWSSRGTHAPPHSKAMPVRYVRQFDGCLGKFRGLSMIEGNIQQKCYHRKPFVLRAC